MRLSILNLLLELLFPRRCVSCGRLGKYICPKCSSIIQVIKLQICPVCERAAIGGQTHPGCQTRYSLDGLTSFFVYDGPVRKAIKELKYRFVSDLAKELVYLSFGGPTSKEVGPLKRPENFVLTPVPLHWWRQNWRGFNQAEILGKMIAEKLEIKFIPDILIRKRATRPQVELEGEERKENIAGAFSVNPRAAQIDSQGSKIVRVSRNQCQSRPTSVIPSKVIVFDDVWTTGATLRTCGNVLKRAGVKRVWGITLAR